MIGVDIVDLSRIDPEDAAFVRHLLTPAEQEEFHARKSAHRKTEYLGGRFAAKEAIFKATGDQMFLSYSILTEVSGKPYVKDHPELDVSISHDGGFAIAAVLCLKPQKGLAK
ncbi:MAG: 4'-phosphopantetheinyl transferase superfamily protein [Solobacterium sp.]|nr:4'-phosphopantetheinyl transferase superfamily protein [Solobacterium sp.]